MAPHSHASISATWLTWARRFSALLLLALAGSPLAHAQNTSTWSGGFFFTGSWGSPSNWNPAAVPTAANNALINTSNGLIVQGVTFLFGSPFISGTDPNGGNFSVNSLILADNSTVQATINFPYLTINASGSLTDNSSIIGNISAPSASAAVTVSDTGTVWTTIGNVTIGDNGGQGVLNVQNLGLVVAGNIATSANTAGGNIGVGAIVLNAGGILQSGGIIQINNAGNATVTVVNPATFTTSIIPNGLQGSGTINGNVSCDGLLNPDGGTIPAGLLVFNDNLTLTGNSILTFPLTGLARATQYSAINVAGNLSLNGTLNIALSNGYIPAVGNVFTLMQFVGNTTGSFTNFTVPFLPGGNGWDVSNLTVNGTVTVVPVFTTQPANTTVIITQNTSLTVATSIAAPAFQWQTSTDNGVTWTNITNTGNFSGANNATLDITNATATMNGNLFRATTTNPTSLASSNPAILTVDTTIFWSGNDSTDWNDPNNWAPFPITPTFQMTAQINNTGGNQPIISTNAAIANFTIGFDGNSSANTSLSVETGGNLTTGNNSYLGFNSNATGALVVNAANATLAKNLFIGWNGTGNLTVSNGGNLTNTTFGYLGTNIGSNGSANITDPGSIWTTDADLNVGYFGNGTLTVGNGATFSLGSPGTATRITVAALGNSTGAIILNNGTLSAASASLAQIVVNSRGSLSGNGTVTPPTTIAGNFTPGNFLTFNQNLSFTSNATLNFTLTGPNRGIDYSAVNVGGSLLLGGRLNIILADGFAPYAGEVFNLFTTTNSTAFVSSFSKVVVPAIPNGLGLDTTNLTINGNITAITVISNQTTSPVTVTETQKTHFFVTAVGPDPRYDWQYSIDNGTTWSDLLADKHFSNVKGATVTLTNATLDMSGHLYRCLVSTDVTSAISNNITLIVIPLFDITAEPATVQSVLSGSTVNFNFAITSPGALTYQWFYNGKPLKDGTKNGTTISGSQSLTLTITGATKTNNGNYTIVATSVLNGHTVGSNLAQLTVVKVKPRLVSQPRSLTTRTDRTASFRAVAVGDQTLNFQWQFSAAGSTYSKLYDGVGPGGSFISGATSSGTNTSTLVITFSSPANNGHYRLKVTNAAGSVTSNSVVLTVN